MTNYACEVAIIGCGPTGVVLANLLGQLGVRVVVLERDVDVFPIPRATHIDEETLRNFQATGLIDELLPHTSPFGTIEIADHDGKVLLRDRVADPTSPHGYAGSRFFDQPAFERVLRRGLERYPSVVLRTGVNVTDIRDDGETVDVDAASGAEDVRIRAAWAVGCDGGRSRTRDAMGAAMETIAPKRPWLIVDTLLRDPADAALLPDGFRYVLATDRLTIYAHGFGLNRRWEFQLEDEEYTPTRETVESWISAFVDPSRVEILRIVPYAHTSLLASPWRAGRLFVAGDAAHMMPPSAGQGMCSGVRDAVNLAWKLHRVLRGRSGTDLLDSYELERSPHVRDILHGTLFIGNRLLGDSVFQRWRRRQVLWAMSTMPRVREYARKRGIRRPVIRDGYLETSSPLAGRFFPQFDAVRDGAPCRSDDGLGYRFARIHIETPGLDERIVAWLRAHRVDWVLVRPDRYIYASGKGELTGLQDLQDEQESIL